MLLVKNLKKKKNKKNMKNKGKKNTKKNHKTKTNMIQMCKIWAVCKSFSTKVIDHWIAEIDYLALIFVRHLVCLLSCSGSSENHEGSQGSRISICHKWSLGHQSVQSHQVSHAH